MSIVGAAALRRAQCVQIWRQRVGPPSLLGRNILQRHLIPFRAVSAVGGSPRVESISAKGVNKESASAATAASAAVDATGDDATDDEEDVDEKDAFLLQAEEEEREAMKESWRVLALSLHTPRTRSKRLGDVTVDFLPLLAPNSDAANIGEGEGKNSASVSSLGHMRDLEAEDQRLDAEHFAAALKATEERFNEKEGEGGDANGLRRFELDAVYMEEAMRQSGGEAEEPVGWVHTVLGPEVPKLFPEGLGGGLAEVQKMSTLARRKRRSVAQTAGMYAARDALERSGAAPADLSEKELDDSVTMPKSKKTSAADLKAKEKKASLESLMGDDENEVKSTDYNALQGSFSEEPDEDEGDLHTIVRAATRAAWLRLERQRQRGFIPAGSNALTSARPRPGSNVTLLTGPPGCGKSTVLAQLVAAARTRGWIVWYVPNADELLNEGGYILPSAREPGVFEQPELAMKLARQLLAAHEEQLETVILKTTRADEAVFGGSTTIGALRPEWTPRESDERTGREIPAFDFRGKSLAELLRFASHIDEHAAAALALFRRELGAMTEYPVLIAVDSINSLFAPSRTFVNPLSPSMDDLPALQAHQLQLARFFLAPDAQALVNGTFVGATSCGRGSGSHLAPWASLRRMAEIRPDLLPGLDAKTGIVPVAEQSAFSGSDHFVVHVPPYNRAETEAAAELYCDLSRSGLVYDGETTMSYQNRNFVHAFTGGVGREVFDYAKVV